MDKQNQIIIVRYQRCYVWKNYSLKYQRLMFHLLLFLVGNMSRYKQKTYYDIFTLSLLIVIGKTGLSNS